MTASRVGWLGAALAFASLWMWWSLAPSLSPRVVQDDARQHIVWMQRLADPLAFPSDLYADYFASQAPPGFVVLFRILLLVGDPIAASKWLPPVLGLVAAGGTFLLAERVYPSRIAAFCASVLGSWYVWQYDDLPTGSPRAFLLPLTVVLLYGLVAGWRWWAIAGLVAVEALFYPSAAALGVALVGARLVTVRDWLPRLPRAWRAWRAVVASAAVALLLLAPAAFGASPFGPTVSAGTARTLPEFGPEGRSALFWPDPYLYWIASYRTGFDLRVVDSNVGGVPIFYELLALAGALPLALLWQRRRASGPSLAPALLLLAQLVAASLLLWLLAHAVLFRLYLPARFVAWTVPLALALAAGIGIGALLARLGEAVGGAVGRVLPGLVALALAGGLASYPAAFAGNFVEDATPAITAYLRTLPADALVVGVPTEADSVPAFAARRVLANREYALPYHVGYAREVDRRLRDQIAAYYADAPGPLLDLASRYGVTVFLVNRAAFDPATVGDAWAGSFEPYGSLVRERVDRGRRFALLDAVRRCGVVTERDVTAVPVACLAARR